MPLKLILSVVLLLVVPGLLHGQCQVEILTGPQSTFGFGVDLDGDVLAVAAGFDVGYVYRLVGSGYVVEQVLMAAGPASTAVSGDVLVMAGDESATVFRYDGADWLEEQVLTPPAGTLFSSFGFCCSVSGEVIVVGAYADDELVVGAGAAYVYRYDGVFWVEEAKLLASNGASGDGFGVSVMLQDDVIVVGAWQHENSGAAYVFRYDGVAWLEEQQLVSSSPAPEDDFGFSVAIDANTIVVGARRSDPIEDSSGAVFVYEFQGGQWLESQHIFPDDGTEGDLFGHDVALSGDLLIAGAYGDQVTCDSTNPLCVPGSAYVFRRVSGSWSELRKLAPTSGGGAAAFGSAVAAFGNTVAGTAIGDEEFVLVARFDDTCDFNRGDVDGDGSVTALSDALYLLDYGFAGGPVPGCEDAADIDDDGAIVPLVDAFYLIAFGFLSGNPPPPPFGPCGADPSDDGLGCVTSLCP